MESKNICYAPFTQLLLQPTGKIGPCCYHFGYPLGQATQESLLTIWNGSRMRKLRREFLDGNIRTCRGRMGTIQCHKHFDYLAPLAQLKEVIETPPVRLDIRLNGQCNLSCLMCDVWQQPNRVYDQTTFWQEGPRDLFPYLKEIDVLGGEPMIQSDTSRLIETVTAVNPDCQWGFVTNGAYQWSRKLDRMLDRIQIKYIQISIDSLDPSTYSVIRRGGDHATTMKTVDRFLKLRTARQHHRPFNLKFSLCVVRQNWHEVAHFLEFCKLHGVEPDLQLAFYDPSHEATITTLPEDELQKITTQWHLQLSCANEKFLSPLISALKNMRTKPAKPLENP